MFSWKTIRTYCVVLLLLPLIHLVILLTRETLASMEGSPSAWRAEMDDYIQQDEGSILPRAPLVVIGGRRVALWEDLPVTAAPKPVLARPLGEATVDDLVYYHHRLVAYYQPGAVLLLPDNTEFRIRDSKSAEELVADIRELVALDGSRGPRHPFYVMAPIKTILFPDDHDKIEEVADLLRAWSRQEPNLVALDPNPLLAGAKGAPDPAFFRSDGVQLNDAGYLRLSLLLRQQLAADYPQEYTISTGS